MDEPREAVHSLDTSNAENVSELGRGTSDLVLQILNT
jgi:hypothetical protein